MPTVTVAGSPVRFDRRGSGFPVVLLHGGGLDSARLSWGRLSPRIAERAEVLAPDLPGHADSPLGSTPPTVDGYSAWLIGFLDALGAQRCVLGGLSLGGAIAIRTTLTHPHRIAGLLACGPYGVDPRVPGGHLGWLTVHAPAVNAATWWALRHSRRAVRAALRGVLAGAVPDDLVDQVRALARAPGAGAAWHAFQRHEVRFSGPRTVFGAELGRIHCPTVFLAGEHDLVPPAVVRAAAGRIPRGAFHEVPAAGHWLPREAPDIVVSQLIHLLSLTVAESMPERHPS